MLNRKLMKKQNKRVQIQDSFIFYDLFTSKINIKFKYNVFAKQM